MTHAAAALAAGLFLAACADPAVAPPAGPPGLMGARARLAAPPAAAVEVVVFDIPPSRRIDAVALIDVRGRRHPAPELVPVTRESGAGVTRPTISVGVSGGSASGVHPWFGLDWPFLGGGDGDRISRRVLARVPVPDPAAYRSERARWRIEVTVTEATGETRSLTFPATRP